MARTGQAIRARDIDEYIDMQPAPLQPLLIRVRRAIAKAVPDAVECVSYGIGAFRLHDCILLYFAGWKEHYSLYPASDAMVAALAGQIDRHRVSKGTLRFPLDEPVPLKLVERVAKFRAKEIAERETTKKVRSKKD